MVQGQLKNFTVHQMVRKFSLFYGNCVPSSMPLDPILHKLILVYALTSYFLKAFINITLASMPRSPIWPPLEILLNIY
jgi:hypothetical protein